MGGYIWYLNPIGKFDVGSFKTVMDPYFFTLSAFMQQDNNILYLLESQNQAEENGEDRFLLW